MGGIVHNPGDGHKSYSWQLEYTEKLWENLGLGVTYLNEGHVPNHHRDGNALQLWVRSGQTGRRLTLSAGLGPYYYYDTTPAFAGNGHNNDHGWGILYSVAGAWSLDSHWQLYLRTNWVDSFATFNSFTALAGLGYRFDEPAESEPMQKAARRIEEKTVNEIALFAGQTIVNSFKSQQSAAFAVEYRRRILPSIDWTGSWIYENDTRLIRRTGLATQFWIARDFLNDRLSLGIGGGAYFPLTERGPFNNRDISRIACGLATLTTSYQILPPWGVRVSWNRVISDYNHDTDIILGGVGYRF